MWPSASSPWEHGELGRPPFPKSYIKVNSECKCTSWPVSIILVARHSQLPLTDPTCSNLPFRFLLLTNPYCCWGSREGFWSSGSLLWAPNTCSWLSQHNHVKWKVSVYTPLSTRLWEHQGWNWVSFILASECLVCSLPVHSGYSINVYSTWKWVAD
jgi:hypothetical protein